MRTFLAERAGSVQLQSHSALRVEFAEYARENPDFLDLTGVVQDVPAPEWVVEAMRRSLGEDVVTSAPTAGLESLRSAIARRYSGDGGLFYEPEAEVLVTCSPTHALSLVCMALVQPGDEVVVMRPGYNFDQFVVFAGGKPVFVDLDRRDGYRIALDKIAAAISPRTKMIATSNPHNPTGRVFSRQELEGLAELAQQHDLLVLSDEVFYGITFDQYPHTPIASLPKMRERTVVVDGITKSFLMPGVRIGWVLGPATMMGAMSTLLRWNVQYVPIVAQRAAEAAINSPKEWDANRRREMQARRDALMEGLAESRHLDLLFPEGTFFCFPGIESSGRTSMEVARTIASDGMVGVSPGSGYHGEGSLRISLAARPELLLRAGSAIAHIFDAECDRLKAG